MYFVEKRVADDIAGLQENLRRIRRQVMKMRMLNEGLL